MEKLCTEIEWQISFWDRGFRYGQWESPMQAKRRLSRMRGTIEFVKQVIGWK